jgi:hypothetical protein
MLRKAVGSLGIQNEVFFADFHYGFVVSLGLSTVTGGSFNLPQGLTFVPANVRCRLTI